MKVTTHLWRYAQRVMKQDTGETKDYFAISIPPRFYDEFRGKELVVTQVGSSLCATVSGCLR